MDKHREDFRKLMEAHQLKLFSPQLYDGVNGLLQQLEKDKVLIGLLLEALIWCSGFDDFAPGGKAHAGWLKVAQPLIKKHIREE